MSFQKEANIRKGLRVKFFVLLVSLLIPISAGEVFVRWRYYDQLDTGSLRRRLEAANIGNCVVPSANPILHFELNKNYRRSFKNAEVCTDHRGFRISCTPAPLPKPAHAVRVAVIGDSTTFGEGVPYEDIYVNCCARKIEAVTGCALDVRNYSVTGYNSLQELEVLRRYVLNEDPQLIILHHDHNDSFPCREQFDQLHHRPECGDNFFNSMLLKLMIRTVEYFRIQKKHAKADTGRKMSSGYLNSGELYDDHIKCLKEFDGITRKRGIPVIMVNFLASPLPSGEKWNNRIYGRLHGKLEQELADTHFIFFDTIPVYQLLMKEHGWDDSAPLWVRAQEPYDRHPNAR